ncbi:MAG: hypothetical protein M3R00_10835 [Pseudomonadota bacterium]|nr:hypothetical protein [Pseudomonadota bacterium]
MKKDQVNEELTGILQRIYKVLERDPSPQVISGLRNELDMFLKSNPTRFNRETSPEEYFDAFSYTKGDDSSRVLEVNTLLHEALKSLAKTSVVDTKPSNPGATPESPVITSESLGRGIARARAASRAGHEEAPIVPDTVTRKSAEHKSSTSRMMSALMRPRSQTVGSDATKSTSSSRRGSHVLSAESQRLLSELHEITQRLDSNRREREKVPGRPSDAIDELLKIQSEYKVLMASANKASDVSLELKATISEHINDITSNINKIKKDPFPEAEKKQEAAAALLQVPMEAKEIQEKFKELKNNFEKIQKETDPVDKILDLEKIEKKTSELLKGLEDLRGTRDFGKIARNVKELHLEVKREIVDATNTASNTYTRGW